MTRFNKTPPHPRQFSLRDSNLLAIVLAFVLCSGCIVFACAAPTAVAFAQPAGANAPVGAGTIHLIPMCAWSRHGAVGLWWNARVVPSRVFSNATRYNAVCVAVPWAAGLPARGRPLIDLTP